MLCKTNALHLSPQLDQFTYLTQLVRLCLVHITTISSYIQYWFLPILNGCPISH
jgi:hypothetical protein